MRATKKTRVRPTPRAAAGSSLVFFVALILRRLWRFRSLWGPFGFHFRGLFWRLFGLRSLILLLLFLFFFFLLLVPRFLLGRLPGRLLALLVENLLDLPLTVLLLFLLLFLFFFF